MIADEIDARQALQNAARLRPLDRNERVPIARIDDGRVAGFFDLRGNPRVVLVLVAAVDHEQKVVGREAVDEHVVHERPVRSRQRGVVRLVHLQPRGVVAGNVLHGSQGVLAGDLDLAHVRDVEEPGGRPHGQMLGDDARVFDRHFPPGEGHHPGAESDVGCVKRGLLEGGASRLGHRKGVCQDRQRAYRRLTVLWALITVKVGPCTRREFAHTFLDTRELIWSNFRSGPSNSIRLTGSVTIDRNTVRTSTRPQSRLVVCTAVARRSKTCGRVL